MGLVLQVGSFPASRIHFSHRRIQRTNNLCNFNLLAKLMKLFRHNLFNLAIVAVAEVILMQICSEQVPSLNRLVPRYLKLVIFSNFWPCMPTSALTLQILAKKLCSLPILAVPRCRSWGKSLDVSVDQWDVHAKPRERKEFV